MEQSIKQWAQSLFDSIKRVDGDGNEYWFAREFYEILGYSSWDNFERLVTKAKVSVAESGMGVENHFLHSVILDFPAGQHEAIEAELALQNAERIEAPYNKYLEKIGQLKSIKLE